MIQKVAPRISNTWIGLELLMASNGKLKTLHIRKSIFSQLLAGLWLVIAGYLVTSAIRGFTAATIEGDATTLLWSLLFLLIATAFIWIALSLLRQSYIITVRGIEVKRLQRKRTISWTEVKTLMALPTFAGPYNYKLVLHDGSNITLGLAFMAHYKRSAKALIEAASIGNPNIKFDFPLGDEFGPPPYGIFTDSKNTNK